MLAAGGGAAAKAISILSALLTVPLTLHYLGTERYGLWVTIVAFTSMLTFADLGIGNGLMTSIAQANGRDDREAVRIYTSSATAALAGVAALVLAALAIAYPLVRWERLLNVREPVAVAEAGPAMAVFIGCFALALPVTTVQRVQTGLQLGFMTGLWAAAGSLLSLAMLLIAIRFEASLPWLVLAASGTPLLIAVINGVIFYGRIAPHARPRVSAVSLAHGWDVVRTGLLFLVLQLTVSIAFMSDNFVISNKLGAAAVTDYAVPDRLFALVSTIVNMATMPLWPAFGEAMARGDRDWVRRTLLRGTALGAGVAGCLSLGLFIAAPWVLHAWVGPTVQPPLLLLAGFAVWRFIEASAGAVSMYLNGARLVVFQIVLAVALAATTLTAKLALVERFGIAVMPWVTSAAYLLTTLVPIVVYLRRRL